MERNTILILSAVNECAGSLFRQPHNVSFYIAPSPLPLADGGTSRETSVSADLDDHYSTSSRIQLTFAKRPRNIIRGYTFGRDPSACDIYLPKSSISSIHFSITFDENGRLCLVDSSTHGTWVSYNGQRSLHPRRYFSWLLPGKDRIEVDIGEKDPVRFLVRVPDEKCEGSRLADLSTYLDDRQRAGTSLSLLDISKQNNTPCSSGAASPKRRPWYYQGEEIGRGSFGKVYTARDVTTGTWYALKEFFQPIYREEIAGLKSLSHVRN